MLSLFFLGYKEKRIAWQMYPHYMSKCGKRTSIHTLVVVSICSYLSILNYHIGNSLKSWFIKKKNSNIYHKIVPEKGENSTSTEIRKKFVSPGGNKMANCIWKWNSSSSFLPSFPPSSLSSPLPHFLPLFPSPSSCLSFLKVLYVFFFLCFHVKNNS